MIRPARTDDVARILDLIHELAEYEKLQDEMDVTEDGLRADLFGASPACEALVADEGAAGTVGYALFFPTYSSFKTRRCLHLEDVYVSPAARGKGHGKALLAAVAAIARDRGCARLDWNVLSWNQPAIDFYGQLGAVVLSDWWLCRLEGEPLDRVAALADKIP